MSRSSGPDTACQIRPARIEDAETLLGLVRELAMFERAADQVQASAEDYRREGFGRTRAFEALLAQADGQVVGFALYFFTFSTWTGKRSLYLEDLYVQPAYRRRGIGAALFRAVGKVALDAGCARYQWQVLDWNHEALAFYEALGARATPEWVPYRLEGQALARAVTP